MLIVVSKKIAAKKSEEVVTPLAARLVLVIMFAFVWQVSAKVK